MKLTLRHHRPTRTATIALASAAAGIALAVPGLAVATNSNQSVPAPPANPTSADQIQNIDQVKTAIKAYYGDTVSGVDDPVPNTPDGSGYQGDGSSVKLHQFSTDGAYAAETRGIASNAEKYLGKQIKKKHTGTPAILFDVDDTTLNTYSYEIYSNFVYNPTTNAYFVNAGSTSVFPGVPGMAGLAQQAAAEGYAVFFLTGRPDSQRAGTVSNLSGAGYGSPDAAHLFMRNKLAPPTYLPCEPTCTTVQYKSLTRQHIESEGYDIVANFGDQYSDLTGGFADKTIKMPNPMYFIS